MKKLLLVIDAQKSFINENTKPYIKKIIRLIESKEYEKVARDYYETIKATETLAKEGFVVMPYMYPDLNTARDLTNAGAASIMPLASPIGSNKGLATKEFIQILIDDLH